ncbi:glycoside hydrolase family 25 protein [Paenibacillus radicis (ex Gao et al. 2016)]|uniref:Glycoside hydrolase family 25 n=1 Tax=Paenibacillus radicis (ex Gao et al. 2016) TaxID=1737354 RepID=A0A917H952_9BACL|nr:GH25 family lysozyme [Paenibacillus radicis (ex Gao et al. 2016)]GGG71177.1 glycoside hydrolase family 25 [Paenibacillus radicis (ex Gao et al. 2016)]
MKHRKRIVTAAIIFAVMIIAVFLEFKGYIWHNSLFASRYEVKGIDVARYQGDIDWPKLQGTGRFQFVYIKATEGQDWTDPYFTDNWTEAKANGFLIGAYHFFTTQSTGEQQADHFIATVPNDAKMLPPVIDIEIALDKDVSQIRQELTDLSSKLERHYGKRPMLYVTYATYKTYIAESFEDYRIWIRDIVKHPNLKKDRQWEFWQYSNRGRADGIDAYVDLNVYNGNQEQFDTSYR